MTMSSSPQEKEKLRKRLQKLFQKHENSKGSASGYSKNNQQPKDTMRNTQKTKSPKAQQTMKGAVQIKNLNKKQQNSPKPKVLPIQNGFQKEAVKESPVKDQKSNQFLVEKDKPKLQQTPTKANKKVISKKCTPDQNRDEETKKHNKVDKKTTDKSSKKSKKNNGFANKSKEKVRNKKFVSRPQNGTELNQVNFSKSMVKNQTKKPEKRAALDDTLSNFPISNKKQKFTKNNIKVTNKAASKEKNMSDEFDSSSAQYENEYDVNRMTGCVPGGEFDSNSEDNMGNSYSEAGSEEDCMESQDCTQNEDFSSEVTDEDDMDYHFGKENENYFKNENSFNKTSGTYSAIRKFIKSPNKFTDSSEESFISESAYDELEDYGSDSFESEEEHYSDFDESDYEEDEDSYSYSDESVYSTNSDDFENDPSNEFYHNESDADYELPSHVPEDLIIHKGTAEKRDLKPEDNVCFNSDFEESQVVELENQQAVKVIYQPKAYDKEELLKLKYEEKSLSTITFQKKKTVNDSEDCPKLVPIVDEDGFQLYNPNEDIHDNDEELEDYEGESMEEYEEESLEEYEDEDMDDVSLGSEYTEIDSDDADSLLSEDINEKYLKNQYMASDSDENVDEKIWIQKCKADVIDATDCKYQKELVTFSDDTETSLNDDINQLPSVKLFKNVDSKTESNILSATIIDDKVQFSNKHFVQELSAKAIESQESDVCINSEEVLEAENSIKESPKAAKSSFQNLVNFNTKFFNAFNSNSVIVLLKDPFYIYGTVRLTLLAGSMQVYGHSLKLNTEVEIFSPRGCSVIQISSSPSKTNTAREYLKELLKSYEQHFAVNDLKIIASLYNEETDAVVLLKRNEQRKKMVQQFKKFMNENVFPNINNINVDRPLYNSEYLLRCMINTSVQEQKCLRLPKEWNDFNLTLNSRVMLAGGKSVGKSTLLRYLINRHLPQKVLLIDLDIGQPEVFIPQTISCTIIDKPLLGPGFLLNLQPEIAFTIGYTNIALCAHKYLSAVRNLISYCKEQKDLKDIPWLINTMGYNKGFGLELISVLAQEPLTDVIQLQSSKEINNFESTLHTHVLSNVSHILFSEEYERNKEEIKGNWAYKLHLWPSAVQQESRYQKEWDMSAKDFRYAMLLARLSEALHGHADWLTDVKPISASLDDLKIINLMDNIPLVAAEELEKVIEANLVYLCHYEEEFKPLKCFGIGVVRAVDFHVRHVYLIPALSYGLLKDVNCLGIGEMPLPTSLFTNQGPRVKNMAPFLYNTVAANASKGIKQIYHRPAKFLTGKHKSLD